MSTQSCPRWRCTRVNTSAAMNGPERCPICRSPFGVGGVIVTTSLAIEDSRPLVVPLKELGGVVDVPPNDIEMEILVAVVHDVMVGVLRDGDDIAHFEVELLVADDDDGLALDRDEDFLVDL